MELPTLPNLSKFKNLDIAPIDVAAGERITATVDSVLLSQGMAKLFVTLVKTLFQSIPATLEAFEEILPLVEIPNEHHKREIYIMFGQLKATRESYEQMLKQMGLDGKAGGTTGA